MGPAHLLVGGLGFPGWTTLTAMHHPDKQIPKFPFALHFSSEVSECYLV